MQRLVLVRHGEAEDVGPGVPDAARALTDHGRDVTGRVAAGLAAIVGPVDLLASSPLVRANETAEIIGGQVAAGARLQTERLEPLADPAAVLDWVAGQAAATVVLVGHEPLLGLVAGCALAGDPRRAVVFGKSASCLIEFGERAEAGKGRLVWHLTPWQMARCGPGA